MLNDHVRTRIQQASYRSLFSAFGFIPGEMREPLVGITPSYNEIVPGHMNLSRVADAVKLGVAEIDDMPVVVPAIAVCDGIAMDYTGMKYSLVTRGLIVDSAECFVQVHQFDAMICVPNYDKNVPGLLVTTVCINISAIFVSGGLVLASRVRGEKRSPSNMFEVVGTYAAGKMTADDAAESKERVCPICDSCLGMYTTSSLNYLIEVLDMSPRGSSTIPVVYPEHLRPAKHVDNQIMEFYRRDIRPRGITTEDTFMNTLTIDMTLGYSTNTMLHLPAVAHRTKVSTDASVADEVSAYTPNPYHPAPAGHTYVKDLNGTDDTYTVVRELSKKNPVSLGCLTATGKTVGENIEYARDPDPEVIRPVKELYFAASGVAILGSSIALESCVMKQSAIAPKILEHSGPARVFDCEDDAIMAIRGGKIVPGDVVVIRYGGPKGDPGICEMLNPTSMIVGMGLDSIVVLVTDGRFPDASRGTLIGHVAPETAAGGPIALIQEGDIIDIDINNHTLNARVSEGEFTEQRKNWEPRVNKVDSYSVHYRELVTGAPRDAVLSVESWHHG